MVSDSIAHADGVSAHPRMNLDLLEPGHVDLPKRLCDINAFLDKYGGLRAFQTRSVSKIRCTRILSALPCYGRTQRGPNVL